MTARERHGLLRDMSEAQMALNSLLQQLGGMAHKSIFGKAARLEFRAARVAGLPLEDAG